MRWIRSMISEVDDKQDMRNPSHTIDNFANLRRDEVATFNDIIAYDKFDFRRGHHQLRLIHDTCASC